MSPVTPTPDELSVLIEARELIRQGWTRGQEYRRRDGKDCYCTLGAIWKAGGFATRASRDAQRRIQALAGADIARWNDRQKSKHPVLAAFDRAIEAVSRG